MMKEKIFTLGRVETTHPSIFAWKTWIRSEDGKRASE